MLNRVLKKRMRYAFTWHTTRANIGVLRTWRLIFDERQGISRLNNRPLVSEEGHAFMQLVSS